MLIELLIDLFLDGAIKILIRGLAETTAATRRLAFVKGRISAEERRAVDYVDALLFPPERSF
jgi:hypothetical protein